MPAKKQTVDFTNVKDGGGQFNKLRLREGDYLARIKDVQDVVAKDKTPMYLYTIEVKVTTKGVSQVGTYPVYCKLEENSLWKLRQLFAAAGTVIPKKRVALDPNKIVGRTIGVTLQDTEYNGRLQSEVQYTIPASEVTSGQEVDDDEDEDEEEPEDETTEDDDEEEEEDEEPTPPPAKKRSAKRQPEPEPEEDEEEPEDEEEEPEPPKRPAKKAASKKKPSAQRTVTDDDLEDLDLDDL